MMHKNGEKAKLKILVVDDEYVSLVKLQSLLSSYGDCYAATHGNQAITMFKKAHKELKPYDLITMDINMPEIQGQDVIEKIRLWESVNRVSKRVKIIMVTAMKDVPSIHNAFNKGCEAYLVKPINKENISKALSKLSLFIQEQSKMQDSSQKAVNNTVRILLVEDKNDLLTNVRF